SGADLSAENARGRSPHCAATRIGARYGTALREPPRAARQKNEIHRMRRRAPVVFRSAVLRRLEPLDLIAIDAARDLERQREAVGAVGQVERRAVRAKRSAAPGSIHVRTRERLAAA